MPILDTPTSQTARDIVIRWVTPTSREEGVGRSRPTPSQEGQLVRNKPLYLLVQDGKRAINGGRGSDFDQHLCFRCTGLGMLPADLFAGPGKIVLSGMLFALV